MALIDDLLKGNPLTGIAIGIGAYLLAPTIGQLLRPAAKGAMKGGILAYRGLGSIGPALPRPPERVANSGSVPK